MSTTRNASDGTYLETTELTKRFGGLTAVSDVDIAIDQGELRCVIGPNGAGKSTFLKLITGQLSPTRGRVRYKGEDITDLAPHKRIRRGMSLKFQVPSLYQELTVRDNMRIALQRNHAQLNQAIDRSLKEFNLKAQERTVVDQLSHGERQWLEIGMAVGVEPDLLLLDEPTAGMTVEETNQTATMLEELNDGGITLVVIEHDIDFVRRIAQNVTVLHQGEVFAEGTMTEIEQNEEVRRIYLGDAGQ